MFNTKPKFDHQPDKAGFYSEKAIRDAKHALSYSTLKATISDPFSLLHGKPDLNSHKGVIFGSLVDRLLFDGPDSLSEEFALVDSFKIPTANSLEIADERIKVCIKSKGESLGSIKPSEEQFIKAARDLKLFEKNKDEVIGKKYTSDVAAYCNAKIISATGKKFFTKEDLTKAERAVEVLKTHEYSKRYLVAGEDQEVYYQVGLIEDYNGQKIKGVYDIFIIDHKHKVILPMDLKTTANKPQDFKDAFRKFDYALQAELYSFMANQYRDKHYPGYLVMDFRYMVLSSRDIENPFIYRFNEKVYAEKIAKPYGIKTLKDYIKEFNHIKTNNEFVYTEEHYTKGFIDLYV